MERTGLAQAERRGRTGVAEGENFRTAAQDFKIVDDRETEHRGRADKVLGAERTVVAENEDFETVEDDREIERRGRAGQGKD